MKVLVTGAGGQLGRALMAAVPDGCEVIGAGSGELDISDNAAVRSFVTRARPEIIINAAAYTAVDRAESEPERAAAVNDTGVANLVAAATVVGAQVVHVSTDFVFDGAASQPYRPDAPTAPLGVYGATKLAGEGHLRPEDLCVRTAWVYAATGQNFVRTMLRLMTEREELGVVADQIGAPTSANDLCMAVWTGALGAHRGIWHFTGSGVASWYDFAVAIRDEGIRIGLLDDSAARVKPIATADYPTPAKRPAYSVLDTTQAAAAIGSPAPYWRHSLISVLEQVRTHG